MKPNRTTVFLLALWALVFAHTVKAATLAEFMAGYDYQSLRWAAGLALLGGALRTIISLQSDTRIVRVIVKEAAWDAFHALIAGLLAFIVLEAIRSLPYAVPSEVRFTAVLVAGIFRLDSVRWMRDTGAAWLAARRAQLIARPIDELPPPPKDAP